MTPEEFREWANLISDPLLLVGRDGLILAVNEKTAELLTVCGSQPESLRLQDLVEGHDERLATFLRFCSRLPQSTFSKFRLRGHAENWRFEGRCVSTPSSRRGAELLLRLSTSDPGSAQFITLKEQLDRLSAEIVRRRSVETQLREQHLLMEFGRDVNSALIHSVTMREMLQRCVELTVTYLECAFARIWTLNSGAEVLLLQASAGMYTHIDGNHSRIPLGEYKIGKIAENQQPHLTNAVLGDPRVHEQEWARREGMVAFAGYPLIVDRRTVGVIAMFSRHPLSERTLEVMASVTDSIALGIERKMVEATLRQHSAALQVASRRKDEFLAMLAHELRNPLVPIRSGIDVLQTGKVDFEVLQLMEDNVNHLIRLVDDLLDVGRILRGKIRLQRNATRLNELIVRTVGVVQPLITERGQQLHIAEAGSEIWLRADAVRLTQVLVNLLQNAAKYTPEGGRIWLEADHDAGEAVIRVRDEGIGISGEFLPEIFELFSQAEQSLDRAQGGLGIGLTLVNRLVELHGGSVSAHSAGVGCGSEFVVRLPLMPVPPTRERSPSRPTDPATRTGETQIYPEAGHALRILLVDDNEASAKIMQRLLTLIGEHVVEAAHSGEEALATAADFEPNLVLLDIGLPGIDGFEVARRLRADPRRADTKIIALTGYGSDSDRRKSSDAGVDLHLVKPVGIEELRKALSACLPT